MDEVGKAAVASLALSLDDPMDMMFRRRMPADRSTPDSMENSAEAEVSICAGKFAPGGWLRGAASLAWQE
jgi:hypothetical protein